MNGSGRSGARALALDGGARWALATLALLLLITAAWWALALWPVPGQTPSWLERARVVCFGAGDDGLPDASGWLLLVGQPLGMLALLMVGWGGAVVRGLSAMGATWGGRAWMAAAAAVVLAGTGAAAARVAAAQGPGASFFFTHELPPPTYPRIDRPAPAESLVDQDGREVSVADFRGRPVIVTFAFGHCATVCPVVVEHAKRARDLLAEEMDPALLVVTLDPWRDTPARLPWLARQWGIEGIGHVLGGGVERVEAALDAWGIARSRDPLTGDVTHPPLVFLVDREGAIAYGAAASPEALAELARRM